ncbi:hypothetical protein HPB50_012081 [Hyalomma asiaticum]|uniref:Uncharacterized protein n=1 Tax=Hyalomma asiaticum TaxID=266040 RepID=A0ACB7TGX0_HYAAI|nr:hypothetical protein HPB50_012081 [Hyalomma asiaticum]
MEEKAIPFLTTFECLEENGRNGFGVLRRTKWKRQSQIKAEQLRRPDAQLANTSTASVYLDLLSPGEHSLNKHGYIGGMFVAGF